MFKYNLLRKVLYTIFLCTMIVCLAFSINMTVNAYAKSEENKNYLDKIDFCI